MLNWRKVQALFVEDSLRHWKAAQQCGLECPFDVFVQLFHEPAITIPSAAASVDWLRVRWTEERMSGAETDFRHKQQSVGPWRSCVLISRLDQRSPIVLAPGASRS
jgi:hypothetical protein